MFSVLAFSSPLEIRGVFWGVGGQGGGKTQFKVKGPRFNSAIKWPPICMESNVTSLSFLICKTEKHMNC